jgi:proteasome lid subunit RPN8/RPN11
MLAEHWNGLSRPAQLFTMTCTTAHTKERCITLDAVLLRLLCSCEVVMDFHAHLDTHEVIGLLAGTWHPEQRLLCVQRAFPVREALPSAGGRSHSSRGGDEDHATAGTDHINVEMDSEDQFKVTEVIQQLYGLQVVGWYHSHPTFCPMPSSIDICNQLMMQRNAAAGSSSGGAGAPGGSEPYIGAILSPYEPRLPEPQSAVTWFHVRHDAGKQVSQDRDLAEQVRRAAGGVARRKSSLWWLGRGRGGCGGLGCSMCGASGDTAAATPCR